MTDYGLELCAAARDSVKVNNKSVTPGITVFESATQLRVAYRLKTPDALHLATAQRYDCAEFWTNDNRLLGIAPSMAVNIFTTP